MTSKYQHPTLIPFSSSIQLRGGFLFDNKAFLAKCLFHPGRSDRKNSSLGLEYSVNGHEQVETDFCKISYLTACYYGNRQEVASVVC